MTLLNLELYHRLFRLVVGTFLMAVGWWVAEAPIWAVSLRVVALYPLLTGLIGWCPVVSLWKQRWDPRWNETKVKDYEDRNRLPFGPEGSEPSAKEGSRRNPDQGEQRRRER